MFEPRYLNMVDETLAHGRMLGMIQPRSSGGGWQKGLQRVGCLGRLASFGETDDGCYLITLVGLARFTVEAELELHRGYRRVRASFEGFEDDLLPAAPLAIDRDALLASLRFYFRTRELDANWDAIGEMSDNLLVTTLCMVCPFGDAEKQALLETPTEADRARNLLALLEIGGHEREPGSGRAS